MRCRALLLFSLSASLCAGSGVHAAAVQQPANAGRSFPDWSGVWENAAGFRYAVPGGNPTPPVLTPEYAARYKIVVDAAAAGRPVSDPTAILANGKTL
jgi:hypothetical protein